MALEKGKAVVVLRTCLEFFHISASLFQQKWQPLNNHTFFIGI